MSNVEYKKDIDNYVDSIFAILGFMHLYRFDDSKKDFDDNTLVFQGKKLYKIDKNGNPTNSQVTPDIGIYSKSTRNGVIGEVKLSFPKNKDHWAKCLEQIRNYDCALLGWPTSDELCSQHDLVIIVHLTRVRQFKKYLEEQLANGFSLSRELSIIRFGRVSQSNDFLQFEKDVGKLSNSNIDRRLDDGVFIPMSKFLQSNSIVKLYDAEPPLPYLMQLIWEFVVVTRVSDQADLSNIRKNQSVEVTIAIDEITNELRDRCSFNALPNNNIQNHPEGVKTSWIKKACESFVLINDAKWPNKDDKSKITFKFKKYSPILEHIIDKLGSSGNGEDPNQLTLPLTGDEENMSSLSTQ